MTFIRLGVFILIFFCFLVPSVFAVNLLQNVDFESGTVSPWVTSGGGAEATISSELVHNGSYALRIQHDTTSSYGFQQIVPNIEEGMFYEVGGYAATRDSNVASYLLRIAWYSSPDGKNSIGQVHDSPSANAVDGQWIYIENLVQAPQNAKSAKVRLVLTTKTNGTSVAVYFDDISFQESVAPTFTPTPVPTDTSTPRPTATPLPTHTPTSTPKPTEKGTATPTQTLSEASQSSDLNKEKEDILGAKTENVSTSSVSMERAASRKVFIITFLFIGIGCAGLSLAIVLRKQFFPKG